MFRTVEKPSYQNLDGVKPTKEVTPKYKIMLSKHVTCLSIHRVWELELPEHVPKTVLYVLGAPRGTAKRIFGLLRPKLESPSCVLRWWSDDLLNPREKGTNTKRWYNYDHENELFSEIEKSQVHDLHAHNIIILYHHDGINPGSLLEYAFHDETFFFSKQLLVIPVAEYIFDRSSCKKVLASRCAPLLFVCTDQWCYSAPLTIPWLSMLSSKILQMSGGGKGLLGELTADFERRANNGDHRICRSLHR